MTRAEVAELLTEISAVDHREVTDADAVLWHIHLRPYELADAQEAVRAHRVQSTEWLQIAHVTTRIKNLIQGRLDRANPFYEPVPGEEDDPAMGLQHKAAIRHAAVRGTLPPVTASQDEARRAAISTPARDRRAIGPGAAAQGPPDNARTSPSEVAPDQGRTDAHP